MKREREREREREIERERDIYIYATQSSLSNFIFIITLLNAARFAAGHSISEVTGSSRRRNEVKVVFVIRDAGVKVVAVLFLGRGGVKHQTRGGELCLLR